MEWVDEDEEQDSDDSDEEEEENLKLPTSPPPPSFLDTRTISKDVLAEVPTYLPGRGYMEFGVSVISSLFRDSRIRALLSSLFATRLPLPHSTMLYSPRLTLARRRTSLR